MKISPPELFVVGLIIVYIAFFTHPPPEMVSIFLAGPAGQAVMLLFILYMTAFRSKMIGLFLGIAYVMSVSKTLEYLDPKEQKAPKPPVAAPPAGPTAAGIPPAAISGMLAALTSKNKSDTSLPQSHGKAAHTKPEPLAHPKPAAPAKIENFSMF